MLRVARFLAFIVQLYKIISGNYAKPVIQGYVVCKENFDALMDAWNQEQEIKAQREQEKREKRVLGNWKRLVKGLVFREKMRLKYMDE